MSPGKRQTPTVCGKGFRLSRHDGGLNVAGWKHKWRRRHTGHSRTHRSSFQRRLSRSWARHDKPVGSKLGYIPRLGPHPRNLRNDGRVGQLAPRDLRLRTRSGGISVGTAPPHYPRAVEYENRGAIRGEDALGVVRGVAPMAYADSLLRRRCPA